jgi:hypothetical protein
MSSSRGIELYARMAGLALRRPGVIPQLVGAAWACRARDWYRRAPFLPLPPRTYLRWRMETAYGDPEHLPEAREIERYVVWASRMRQMMRRRVDV